MAVDLSTMAVLGTAGNLWDLGMRLARGPQVHLTLRSKLIVGRFLFVEGLFEQLGDIVSPKPLYPKRSGIHSG
jgi:hypothetical protein